MTPFLFATLLALLIVGGLFHVYRKGNPLLFRKALAGAAATVVFVAAYAAWISGGELGRIAADQVALSDLRIVEAAGSFRLEGRASNRSATHTLLSLPLHLLVEDCVAGGDCEVVHDETREVLVTIPPGGSVAFNTAYAATAGPPRGERRWRVAARAPRADEP